MCYFTNITHKLAFINTIEAVFVTTVTKSIIFCLYLFDVTITSH